MGSATTRGHALWQPDTHNTEQTKALTTRSGGPADLCGNPRRQNVHLAQAVRRYGHLQQERKRRIRVFHPRPPPTYRLHAAVLLEPAAHSTCTEQRITKPAREAPATRVRPVGRRTGLTLSRLAPPHSAPISFQLHSTGLAALPEQISPKCLDMGPGGAPVLVVSSPTRSCAVQARRSASFPSETCCATLPKILQPCTATLQPPPTADRHMAHKSTTLRSSVPCPATDPPQRAAERQGTDTLESFVAQAPSGAHARPATSGVRG